MILSHLTRVPRNEVQLKDLSTTTYPRLSNRMESHYPALIPQTSAFESILYPMSIPVRRWSVIDGTVSRTKKTDMIGRNPVVEYLSSTILNDDHDSLFQQAHNTVIHRLSLRGIDIR